MLLNIKHIDKSLKNIIDLYQKKSCFYLQIKRKGITFALLS